ncbi:HET-domain-containing protein, partial [Thozetella sp. PMI_491]
SPQTMPLCEYCSKIDFSALRLPTKADLEACSLGNTPDKWPFKSTTTFKSGRNGGHPTWRLGLRSRIERSAATCSLCAAICMMIRDKPQLRELLSVEDLRDGWCAAWIEAYGRISPHYSDSARRSSETRDYYYLRSLSLVWFPRHDKGEPLLAGEMDHQPGYSWVNLTNCFQVAPSSDDASQDKPLFGGQRRPALIDVRLPSRWLQTCISLHHESCSLLESDKNIFASPRQADIYLLYLTSRKYAALSYVWGARQRLVLTEQNRESLKRPCALDGTVSRTIQDAISFTATVGLTYIWVDALCIIQDNDDDKAAQISNFSGIYTKAVFTIVAAAGIDAEKGLPGVSMPRTSMQHEVPVSPDMSLLTTLSSQATAYAQTDTHSLAQTKWASRGWTLQERALSRRLLMFTEDQILWTCGATSAFEEIENEIETLDNQKQSSPPAATISFFALDDSAFQITPNNKRRAWYVPAGDQSQQLWYKFQRMVSDFTSRDLTEQGDAHDAFAAILEQVQRLDGEKFLWGLPATRFELGLCWEPTRHPVKRRTANTTLPTTSLKRKVPFPSWSYLGWCGRITLRVEDKYVEEGITPEIMCYVLRNTPLRLVRISRLTMDVPGDRRALPFANRLAVPAMQSPLAVYLDDITLHFPELPIDRLKGIPDDQIIFFWTEVATFTVSATIQRELWTKDRHPNNRTEYQILQREVLEGSGKVIGQISPCESTGTNDSEQSAEFALLATSALAGSQGKVLALQIETKEGVAYRVNIAEIEEQAWRNADTQRRLIALQ